MSSNVPIAHGDITAPTPQNTPLTHAPIAAGLSRLTVPDISEDDEPAEDETDDPAQITGVQATMLGLVQRRLADLELWVYRESAHRREEECRGLERGSGQAK